MDQRNKNIKTEQVRDFLAGKILYHAWRIIPVSKWLVAPIYKPFRPFGMGITLLRGLTIHGYEPLTNWDDPPSAQMLHTNICRMHLPSFTINLTQVSSTFAQEHGGSLREKPSGAIRSEGTLHLRSETVDPGNVDVVRGNFCFQESWETTRFLIG